MIFQIFFGKPQPTTATGRGGQKKIILYCLVIGTEPHGDNPPEGPFQPAAQVPADTSSLVVAPFGQPEADARIVIEPQTRESRVEGAWLACIGQCFAKVLTIPTA